MVKYRLLPRSLKLYSFILTSKIGVSWHSENCTSPAFSEIREFQSFCDDIFRINSAL